MICMYYFSHAIMCYLVTKYGKDDSLYPKDPEIRAKVDQFLHLDTGCLFMTLKLIGVSFVLSLFKLNVSMVF